MTIRELAEWLNRIDLAGAGDLPIALVSTYRDRWDLTLTIPRTVGMPSPDPVADERRRATKIQAGTHPALPPADDPSEGDES